MAPKPTLILASQSPARRALLTAAGFQFQVEPSDFDEDSITLADPPKLVEVLAIAKAETIARRHSEPVLVIGCDSVFVFEGDIFGKPRDAAEAMERLQRMQGRYGDLYTGHVVLDTQQQRQVSHVEVTRVYLDSMTSSEIRQYVATGEPICCSGSFSLNGLGSPYVSRLEGCYSNVIGLSLPALRHLLTELGFTLSDFR